MSRPCHFRILRVLIVFTVFCLTSHWVVLATPPSLPTELPDQTVMAGSTVQFEVFPEGTAPFSYEWRSYLGTAYTVYRFATNSTLVLTNVLPTNRKVAAVISNSEGSITSRLATLTVLRPAGFSSQIDSTIAIQGSAVSLSAGIVGTTPLYFQWLFNGEPIPGRTARTLNLSGLGRTHDGAYQLVVTNLYGASTSRIARVHVIPAPTTLDTSTFTTSSSTVLPYRIFTPNTPTPNGLYPLVLSLHGAGEKGNDNLLQLSAWPQSMVFISLRHQEEYPCYFVAPQCPSGRDWRDSNMQPELVQFIHELKNTLPIDLDRIYLTGLSMGGYGTWEIMKLDPDLVAAAVPICGGGTPSATATFKHVPIWNFHSATDGTVPVLESRSMISAMRLNGGNPIYTEYADGGHAIWAQAWATPDLVPWVMSHRRGSPSLALPRLSTESPTIAETGPTLIPGPTFTLSGSLTLSEPIPAVVAWTNFTTRIGGFAQGSAPWIAQAIPINIQVTNKIGILAATSSWAPALGGSTTFTDQFEVAYAAPLVLALTPSTQDGSWTLSWTGANSPVRVEYTSDILSGQWALLTDSAVSPLMLFSSETRRFYRVVTP